MSGIIMAALIVLGALAQSLVPPVGFLAGAKIPFLVGVTLYAALTRERPAAVVVGLVAGVVLDGLGLVPLGTSSLCLAALAWAVNRFRDVVYVESAVTAMFFGAVAGAAVSGGVYAALRVTGLVEITLPGAMLKCVGVAVLGVMATPAVFRVGNWLDAAVGSA